MKKILFKFLSPLVMLSMVVISFAPLSVYAGSPDYNVHINTPVISANPLSISGTATSNKYVGQETAQHVVINWGDGTPNTDMPIPLANINTSANTFSWNWGPQSHLYTNTTTQSYNIIVNVCHQNCTGAEGSGDSTDTTQVVIPPQGNLIVQKVVINDNGGTSQAGAFSFSINGDIAIPFTQIDPTHGENYLVKTVGTYNITEPTVVGYSTTYNNCTNLAVPLNGSATCTITNNDIGTPTLSVTNSPVTYTGLAQSATVIGSVPGVVSDVQYDGSSTIPTDAGTYVITADFSPTDAVNYSSLSDSSAGNFVINKADTTTTVSCPSSVVYNGIAQTPCTVSVAGFGLSLTPNPIYSNNVDAGTATASYSYAGNTNYNPSNDSKDFTISKADATVNVTGYTGIYDGIAHSILGSAIGILSEVLSGLDLGASFTDVPGGIANWTFTDSTGNYNNQNGTANIVINPKTVTVTADNLSKTFGDSDPTFTYGVSGLVSPDDKDNSFSGSLSRGSGEDIGEYTIGQGDLVLLNTNYILDFVLGTFTISDKAILTVTANNQSITYGDVDPEFTFSYSGWKNDDNESVVDSSPVCSVSVEHLNVGSYSIDCSGGSADNYTLSYSSGTLNINPKPITVVADAQTKVYGTVDPTLTYTNSELVGSDTLFGNLTREVGEDVGIYAITQGTVDNTNNSNYSITYIGADLTITQADQSINFDPLEDKTMGDGDFQINATATSNLPVTFTSETPTICTVSDNTVHIMAIGTCTIIASQTGNNNYTPAQSVSQSFEIATLLHTITSSTGTNGSISPVGGINVADGNNQVFTMTPDSGYIIADVLVDEVSVGAVGSYQFTNVIANHVISVTFTVDNQDTTGGDEDSCKNIEGIQDAVPEGMIPDEQGNCNLIQEEEEDNGGGRRSSGSYIRGSVLGASTGQVLGAETTCGIYVDKYLRKGLKLNDMTAVVKVQLFLNNYMNAGLITDGVFGPKTDAALRAFQAKHSDKVLVPWGLLKPTGIFYQTTQTEVNNIMCPSLDLPIPTLIPIHQNPLFPKA